MVEVLNFYLDDSGTRHPDRKPGRRPEHGCDYFALGGVLVNDEDEEVARRLHQEFCERWELKCPVHSVEVRARSKNFVWLLKADKRLLNEFYESLYQLMRSAPVTGLACVIDRPGYNARYREKYGRQRWSLCKTAFSVVVERAAKRAQELNRRLRIMPEMCNKKEDRVLRSYYDSLRTAGMPFDFGNSGKYGPLKAEDFKRTLYEFSPKSKTSPMAQLADLFLWPICMGGYHASNRPYRRLMEDGKLIECVLPREKWETHASKYSCFENVERTP